MILLTKHQFKTNTNGGSAMRSAVNCRLITQLIATAPQFVLTATTFLVDDFIP